MDTSSKGVKLRILPTCSGERARLPMAQKADVGMRLLWEFCMHETEMAVP
jgi:hypothetical protein